MVLSIIASCYSAMTPIVNSSRQYIGIKIRPTQKFVCQDIYILREPQRDISNRKLNEHGIYIRRYLLLEGLFETLKEASSDRE